MGKGASFIYKGGFFLYLRVFFFSQDKKGGHQKRKTRGVVKRKKMWGAKKRKGKIKRWRIEEKGRERRGRKKRRERKMKVMFVFLAFC